MVTSTKRMLVLICSVMLAFVSAQSLRGAVVKDPASRELLTFASMPGSGSGTDCEDGSNVPVSYTDTGSSETDCENGSRVPVSYATGGSSSNETDCENGSRVPVSYSLEGSDCENGSNVPVRY